MIPLQASFKTNIAMPTMQLKTHHSDVITYIYVARDQRKRCCHFAEVNCALNL